MNLYAVVILKNSKKILVVPFKHCEIYHDNKKCADILNNGIKQFIVSKIYFTPHRQNVMKPNFTIELNHSLDFDETAIALYDGFVLKLFGK
jgi:hypothetical protein